MPPALHADDPAVPPPNSNSRSWARRRYSSFFHGESVVTARSGSGHSRKASTTSQRSTRMRTERPAPVRRSHTSTQSLIDPNASPVTTYSPISQATFEHLQRHTNPPPLAHIRPQRTSSELHRAERHLVRAIDRTRRRQARHHTKEEKVKRTCLPHVRNPKIRRKIFGSLISGTLLAILFIIYLALAISNSFKGKAWNVILIILILINTIVCCHYIIRLCMLARRAKRLGRRNRIPCEADEEGYAQPATPIPIILARDEELGLHANVDDDDDDDDESVHVPIPPPPPAYGLWRCSVRADPNLIHWQRTGHPEVQKETRNLIRAGQPKIRPPSYAEEEGSLRETPHAAMHVRPLFQHAAAANPSFF